MPEFTHAIHQLRGVRLRGGALRWGIYRDAANPEDLNETFIMESWLDYLRSRERVTAADDRIRQRVWALHQDDEPPRTTYQVYAREIANPTPPSTQALVFSCRCSTDDGQRKILHGECIGLQGWKKKAGKVFFHAPEPGYDLPSMKTPIVLPVSLACCYVRHFLLLHRALWTGLSGRRS